MPSIESRPEHIIIKVPENLKVFFSISLKSEFGVMKLQGPPQWDLQGEAFPLVATCLIPAFEWDESLFA